MDQDDAPRSLGVLPLPQRGLDTVCSLWTGRGELWKAIASVDDADVGQMWSDRQVRNRAYRVLFTLIAPSSARLPGRANDWIEALPAESRRSTVMSQTPGGRVDWRRTRERSWPPREFVIRRRERRPDNLLLTALAWVAREAGVLLKAAPAPASPVERAALERLGLLEQMFEHPIVAAATPAMPRGDDHRALQASGTPWRELGRLAKELSHIEGQRLADLARTLLAPDAELRWRLFHLAVLGEVIASFNDIGGSVTSLRPLGDGESSKGPSFAVTLAGGGEWEIWFEAAGVWSHLGIKQPYQDIRGAFASPIRPLGADILVVDAAMSRGLFIECKFSGDATVVGRGGYHQATTYLMEAVGRLFPTVVSVAVGPSSVVETAELMRLGEGWVGFVAPDHLAKLVKEAVEGTGHFAPITS